MSPSASNGATALEKRIRRHVIGRPHPFWAVAAPGLEAVCAEELAALLPHSRPRPAAGGVFFTARLDEAQQANLMLHTATRIRMRIAEVRATHFAQLEKALAAIAWELYLGRETPVQVQVAVHRSRLFHRGAVAERVVRAVAERRRRTFFPPIPGDGDPPPQMLHVRADHDRFTLSLDTSGERLHRRGLKTQVGRAPLRETTAAAILRAIGYDGDQLLLDPMCGAGTFSLEAAMMACRIPAGWYRDFAFTRWPSFRPRRWDHLRRVCAADRRSAPPAPIVAADRDPEAVRRFNTTLARTGLAAAVDLACRDFFAIDPQTLDGAPGLLVLNPPYGRRLGTRPAGVALAARIGRHLEQHYPGWRVALIVPPGAEDRVPRTLRPAPLRHGGLPLTLFTGRIGD